MFSVYNILVLSITGRRTLFVTPFSSAFSSTHVFEMLAFADNIRIILVVLVLFSISAKGVWVLCLVYYSLLGS